MGQLYGPTRLPLQGRRGQGILREMWKRRKMLEKVDDLVLAGKQRRMILIDAKMKLDRP